MAPKQGQVPALAEWILGRWCGSYPDLSLSSSFCNPITIIENFFQRGLLVTFLRLVKLFDKFIEYL